MINLKKWLLISLTTCALVAPCLAQSSDSDVQFAVDFWQWRARTAPFSADDVNRMERPAGIVRDWSASGIEQQRKQLASFDERWKKLDDLRAPIHDQVDHRLLGSALARVHWELDILKRWQRDPNFYIDQALSALAEALTVPSPYNEAQSREILSRLNNIPAILRQAQQNLQSPPAPFTQIAVDSLTDVHQRLQQVALTLPAQTTIDAAEWQSSADKAAASLEQFREYLQKILPTLPANPQIGRQDYVWFLKNVALMPYTPEELISAGEQEWHRAVAFESLEINRNRAVEPLKMAADLDTFIARNRQAELDIRRFLELKQILTLPAFLQHYTLRPLPPYLAPLADFAETDDFTSPSRLVQDGIRYVNPPSPTASYFWAADLKDPRIQIVHEGTVGHYGQLCISWKNPDSIRRHYYDSGANEGIGFYAEEMMLQAGLYDDSPHSREIVYNQARLRALRMIADVKIGLGTFTLQQAADFLEHKVPMSKNNAWQEAVEMIEVPGQKISYQAGKLQILQMMADARLQQGEKFNLRDFHDFVWLNGNVPIALQRWEYLRQDDSLRKIENLK